MEDLMRDPDMKQVIKTPSSLSGERSLESDEECGTRAMMPSQERSEKRYQAPYGFGVGSLVKPRKMRSRR